MRIFVASAKEARKFVDNVLTQLPPDDHLEFVPWYSGVVKPSRLTLEGLLEEIPRFDGALFAITGRDLERLGAGEGPNPRENIYFELGLAIATLGRENVLVLNTEGTELPSDLSGLTTVRASEDLREAQASQIAARIQRYFRDSAALAIPQGIEVITRPAKGEYNSRFYDYLKFLLTHRHTRPKTSAQKAFRRDRAIVRFLGHIHVSLISQIC